MAKEPNENDEVIEDEVAEGEEADDTSTGDEAEGDGEGEGTGADEGEGDGDGEGDEGEGADDEFVLPEKFKGKSAEEIARSYVNLEKNLEKKVADKVREEIGKARPGGKVTKTDDDAIKKAMEGVDFSKMKPEEFAAWLIKTVESRAQEIARNTYEAADSTKQQVQTEINTVTKTWPQLKENEGFRTMVLALIENAAAKGEILTLKEACKKVGAAMGVKPGAKPAEGGDGKGKDGEGKRPRTGVERPSGSGGGERETDEQKVLDGLMAGSGGPGKLGGLGI